MGKMSNLIIVLVFLDLLFLITGQHSADSISSSLLQTVFSPQEFNTLNWFNSFFTLTGLLIIGITSAITVVSLASRDVKTAIATIVVGSLSLLSTDLLAVYVEMQKHNPIIAILIFSPLMIYLIFTTVEWVLGKD